MRERNRMVLFRPELGNDEGINVDVISHLPFGYMLVKKDSKDILWREKDDPRIKLHKDWEEKHRQEQVDKKSEAKKE